MNYGAGKRDRIFYGYFTEPIATTMQKQMLKGVKARAEGRQRSAAASPGLALSY
jgi:hypothetical protein